MLNWVDELCVTAARATAWALGMHASRSSLGHAHRAYTPHHDRQVRLLCPAREGLRVGTRVCRLAGNGESAIFPGPDVPG